MSGDEWREKRHQVLLDRLRDSLADEAKVFDWLEENDPEASAVLLARRIFWSTPREVG